MISMKYCIIYIYIIELEKTWDFPKSWQAKKLEALKQLLIVWIEPGAMGP